MVFHGNCTGAVWGGLGPEDLEICSDTQMYPHLKYIVTLHSTI
jgi:hypothetical protein